MVGLHGRADGVQTEKIRVGLQQLSAELDATHKARIRDSELCTAGGRGIFDRGEHEGRSGVVRLCEVSGNDDWRGKGELRPVSAAGQHAASMSEAATIEQRRSAEVAAERW